MEELATVLVKSGAIEFKALFTVVHGNLKSRNAANGGEEMLRLRSYEKLQTMVQSGLVQKVGKEYRGVMKMLVPYLEAAAAQAEGETPATPVPQTKPAAQSKAAAQTKPPVQSKARVTTVKAVAPKTRPPARRAIAIS